MVPQWIETEKYFSWEDDFPYLIGLFKEMNLGWMPHYEDERSVFMHFEMYSEFKNLTVLDLSVSFNAEIKDFCNVKSALPYVETLIVTLTQTNAIEKKCKDLSGVPWLIVTNMHGQNPTTLYSKVIGIFSFGGSLENLKKFRYLRYLGISNYTSSNDIGFLAKNINLTHLILNMRKGVKNLSEIRQLKNLKALTITCTIAKTYVHLDILEGEPCEKSPLTDLSFLLELPWLEKLVLPSNRLEDVSVISKLTNLTHLNLSHNNISVMPDVSALKNLKHFDISHNPVNP